MTQTEYEKQGLEPLGEFPKRTPVGTVEIERFRTWNQGEIRYYDLTLWDETYGTYRTWGSSNVLWTMDENGEVKSPSVFREPETATAKY